MNLVFMVLGFMQGASPQSYLGALLPLLPKGLSPSPCQERLCDREAVLNRGLYGKKAGKTVGCEWVRGGMEAGVTWRRSFDQELGLNVERDRPLPNGCGAGCNVESE